MQGPWIRALGCVLLALLSAGGASAARLAFVVGTIEAPADVNEGDELAPGTVVKSGDDALVMVEHRWPSDVSSRDCIQIAIFGYGQSYKVSENETPGRCQTTVPNLAALDAGKPFLTRETRYGDAKFDEPKVAQQVATAQARWQAFDHWVRNAQRTFSGVVTSVGGNRIALRSPESGRQTNFAVNPSTVDTPVALGSLVNKRVQVDYRYTATGPQALRIRLTAPEGRPTGPVRVEPIPHREDGRATTAPQRVEEVPSRPRDSTQPATIQTWGCTLDLHQGDSGTLQLDREGAQLRGAIVVRDGSQRHPVSGTWRGDRIEFWRELSASSGQRFGGVAIDAGDGEVRMAGRFANRYSGVWSAECKPGAAPAAGPASPTGLDVVLIDVGDDKIAVIKAVREITGIGLREAKAAVESTPYTVQSGLSAEDAERLAAAFQRVGARVSIRPTR